jgi:ADP-heptose:LPS heptosyltransferase
LKILLTGSPREKAMCERITKAVGGDRILNVAGALRLGEAAALIGELDVFVTPDTGPMHIAVTLGIPSVALFAVADPVKSGAAYDNAIHIEIKKPRTCNPCVSKLCKYQECMLQIESSEVAEATLRLL